MAYLQITTRCQMTCAHCAYSCEPGKGEDMSQEVFNAALKFATCVGEHISIGGGEPTLHPNFWHFLIDCIAHPHVEGVWMATNGGVKETALKLASLAKKGVLAVALSLDDYHDPIDAEVQHAFTEGLATDGRRYFRNHSYGECGNDMREVRTVENPMPRGRAKSLAEATGDGCVCDDVIITPNGDMYLCACEDAPKIGNILTGYEFPRGADGDEYRGCYQDYEPADEEENAA